MLLDRIGPIADAFSRAGAGAAAVIAPFERLDAALVAGVGRLGVEVAATVDPALLTPHFGRLALIAIAMPSFSDGRAFSLARRLRRDGFSGRLRIVGPIIADQFPYVLACGVDEVELPPESAARQPAEHWRRAAAAISLGYQRGLARDGSILDQRRAARAGGST